MTENIVLPSMILNCYRQIGLDDTQLLIVIHFMVAKTDKPLEQNVEELCIRMSSSKEDIKKGVAMLIERGIITFEGRLQLNKLLSILKQFWQQNYIPAENQIVGYDETSSLYTLFEQEFGRLLTPMEGDQIREWIEIDKYEYSLIKGALKRTVLRGVLNFKYVDSILREWRRKNFRNINEVIAYENKYGQQKEEQKKPTTETNKKQKNSTSKYKDIYMG